MSNDDQEERVDRITAKTLLRLPSFVVSGVKYHAAGRFYVPKPLYSTIRVLMPGTN